VKQQGVTVRIIVLLLAALLSPLAHADLFTAQLAYKKGDFQAAARDYRAMAELGNPIAQYDLAALYVNGQGVPQSPLNAYAWASLAAVNGNVSAKALVDKIRPTLAPGSEQIAQDIVAPYNRAALDAQIMPKIENNSDMAARCRWLAPPQMEFPVGAKMQGISGDVFIEYTVAPDGSTRNPRIVYAVPNQTFDETARAGALHTRFAALPGVGHCVVMYRFVMQGASYPQLESFAARTRKDADAGDPNSQFLYGLLLAGLPQLGKKPSDAMPWFLKAAQNGSVAAQYQVGSSLMFGLGCHCEATKGEVWLTRAAEAGSPEAQVSLGTYALRGAPTEDSTRIAQLWLERAVASNDHDGMYYLAALLAAAPDAHVRDPKRALYLLEQLKHEQDGNPSVLEIRAAAQASAGSFADAADSQHRAIKQAERLKWDLGPLNERLARYESKQPWYGSLLVL
jgi:TonB family protein